MHVAWAAWIGGRKHNSTPNGGHALHEAISFNCVSQFLINLRSELSMMHAKVEETVSFHPAVDVYLAVCNNLSDLIVSLSQRGHFFFAFGRCPCNYPGGPPGVSAGGCHGDPLGLSLGGRWFSRARKNTLKFGIRRVFSVYVFRLYLDRDLVVSWTEFFRIDTCKP